MNTVKKIYFLCINNNIINGFILFIPLLVLYIYTAPTTLPDYDAGEFIVIAVKGGIAHPPGYPLLIILLKLFELIPLDNLVFRLSLFSILCTYLSAIVIFNLLCKIQGRKIAAVISIYLVFLTTFIWRNANNIEPFALNILLASGILFCCWQLLDQKTHGAGNVWVFLLGLLFGLGFCNHHSLAFILPMALASIVTNKGFKWSHFGFFLLGSLGGLIPLIYFFADHSNPLLVWGDWSNPWEGLLHHVFRRDYGTFSLLSSSKGSFINGPFYFVKSLLNSQYSILMLLFLLGVIYFLWNWKGEVNRGRRLFLFYSLGTLVFIVIVFLGLCNIRDIQWHKSIIERFFALPLLFYVFFLIINFFDLKSKKYNLVYILLIVFIIFHCVNEFHNSNRKNEVFYENHVKNIINTIKHNSLIITYADTNYFGMLYGKYVLNNNKDFHILQYGLWNGWYGNKFIKYNGLNTNTLKETIEYFIKNDSVYTVNEKMIGIRSFLDNSYPIGPLVHFVETKEKVKNPVALFRLNERLFLNTYHMPDKEYINSMTIWEQTLLTHYKRTWNVLSKSLEKAGVTPYVKRSRRYEEYFER